MVRQVQHRPSREGAQGRELAGLKRELAQARRIIARQEKRIRQLEAQLGETPGEPEESSVVSAGPQGLGPSCPACGSLNVSDVSSFTSTLRCCRDCKNRSKVASV